jgi:hypothetical protein
MTGGSLAQKEFTFSRSSRLAGAGQACTPPHDRENRAQMTWFWRFWPMVQDALPAGSPEAAPGVGFLYIFLFSGPGGCVMSFLPNPPPPQMTDVISMNTKTVSFGAANNQVVVRAGCTNSSRVSKLAERLQRQTRRSTCGGHAGPPARFWQVAAGARLLAGQRSRHYSRSAVGT